MNEPEKEYGWNTAITPEEIRGLERPQIGDEFFKADGWCRMDDRLANRPWHGNGFPVRRRHDPGPDHEIVPGDERETDDMEFLFRGVWHPNKYRAHNPWPCKQYFTRTGIQAFRRRKSAPEPAMDEGWEIVPKDEVEKAHNEKMTGWQFLDEGTRQWIDSGMVHRSEIYRRRPKSKPEQYGWLKPDCGVEMPNLGEFEAILENGQRCTVCAVVKTGKSYLYKSSGMPLTVRIAYWFRMPPAPEAVKVDPCESALDKYANQSPSSSRFEFWRSAWQACEAHHAKGAK